MTKRFRDPVHGFLSFDELELALIDTRPFQRLRHISQLALTDAVYPGATHSRFAHALGVAHVANRMLDALEADGAACALLGLDREGWQRARALARVAALLHDIGHAPFSHAGEELFAGGLRHEHQTARLIRESEIAEILSTHPKATALGIDAEAVIGLLSGQAGSRVERFLSLLLAGEIDADRCDYLLRDAGACGVRYGLFDLERLLETLTAWETPDGHLVPAVRYAGLCAAEGMVTARYFMYREVYHHKTRRILDLLLEKALKNLLPGGHFPQDVEAYLAWDDHRAWELLRTGAKQGDPAARRVVHRLPLSCVLQVERTGDAAEPYPFEAAVTALQDLEDPSGVGVFVDTTARIRIYRPPERRPAGEAGARDIWVVDRAGRARSLFAVSSVLRRMDPNADILRVYVAPQLRETAELLLERIHRGVDPAQLSLTFPISGAH